MLDDVHCAFNVATGYLCVFCFASNANDIVFAEPAQKEIHT